MREKSVFVFDVDGTLLDLFNGAARRGRQLVEGLAALHDLPPQQIMAEIRQMPMSHIIDDPRLSIEALACIAKDRDGPDKARFQARHEELLHDFARDLDSRTTAFDGVADTFEAIRAGGGKVVIYTDADAEAFAHRAWLARLPVDKIDAVFTQPGTPAPAPAMALDTPESRYKSALRAKIEALPPDSYKPKPVGFERISAATGAAPDQMVMVGDTYKDGLAARNAGVDFAFQKQGADVGQDAIDFMAAISPSYPVGVDPTEAKLREHDIRPAAVLERGIPPLLTHFAVRPAPAVPTGKPANRRQPQPLPA